MVKPKPPARKPSKPTPDEDTAVLSVRIPPSKVAALDAWVAALNADPANPGRVTRNSLILHIIDGALAARAKAAPRP